MASRSLDHVVRVLLVEHAADTRDAVDGVLRGAGYAVRYAASGADAVALARAECPDAVISDFHLPDVDGLGLFRRLLDLGIARPFVVVADRASTVTAFEAGRLGVAGYIERPIHAEQLLDMLWTHTAGPSKPETAAAAYAHQVVALIEERYADPGLDVHSAAAACGITREHLARVIRGRLGCTFTDLLRLRRMREARRLLTGTSLRIKEIYQQVGLTRASDFDHAFKRTWGMSPKGYRARHTKVPPA